MLKRKLKVGDRVRMSDEHPDSPVRAKYIARSRDLVQGTYYTITDIVPCSSYPDGCSHKQCPGYISVNNRRSECYGWSNNKVAWFALTREANSLDSILGLY